MVRTAKPEDYEDIIAIYNQAIEAGFQTGFMETTTVAERSGWFRDHAADKYPLLVFEEGNSVAGWFSASPYRTGRAAFRYTVEVSYFVHNQYFQKGIGKALLADGLERCRQLRYKTAIAIILDMNNASVKLAEKFGFERWGFLPGVADFNGTECNHLYYGVKL
jgi:phosphinothricin acetyltransferase